MQSHFYQGSFSKENPGIIKNFNAGFSAYKKKNYNEAIKHFEEASKELLETANAGTDFKVFLFEKNTLGLRISCALAECYLIKAKEHPDYIKNAINALNHAKIHFKKVASYQQQASERELNALDGYVEANLQLKVFIDSTTFTLMNLYWNEASRILDKHTALLDAPKESLAGCPSARTKESKLARLLEDSNLVVENLINSLARAKVLRTKEECIKTASLLAEFHERLADVFSEAYEDPQLSAHQSEYLLIMRQHYESAFKYSRMLEKKSEKTALLYVSVLNVLETQALHAEEHAQLQDAAQSWQALVNFSQECEVADCSGENISNCIKEVEEYKITASTHLANIAEALKKAGLPNNRTQQQPLIFSSKRTVSEISDDDGSQLKKLKSIGHTAPAACNGDEVNSHTIILPLKRRLKSTFVHNQVN